MKINPNNSFTLTSHFKHYYKINKFLNTRLFYFIIINLPRSNPSISKMQCVTGSKLTMLTPVGECTTVLKHYLFNK